MSQQQRSTALASRFSMDSQEGSWSSTQHLMASSDKEMQDEKRISAKCQCRRCSQILWMHGLLMILYTFTFIVAIFLWNSHDSQHFAYSPASKAIRYQKVLYEGKLDEINSFRGERRPELDKAWGDLLEHGNIRINEEELRRLNRSSIELHDGSGYFGKLGVYHHLHCLKFLRQVLHSNSYDVNTPDRDVHVDHCVDDIRQALMCHADTSILTYTWRANWRRPWPKFSVDHTCVDWNTLDSWAADRSFSAFDQISLVHPNLGIAFPMVNGSIENVAHGPNMHIVWPEDGA